MLGDGDQMHAQVRLRQPPYLSIVGVSVHAPTSKASPCLPCPCTSAPTTPPSPCHAPQHPPRQLGAPSACGAACRSADAGGVGGAGASAEFTALQNRLLGLNRHVQPCWRICHPTCSCFPQPNVFVCWTHPQVEGGPVSDADRRQPPLSQDLPRPMVPFSRDELPGLCAMQASASGNVLELACHGHCLAGSLVP